MIELNRQYSYQQILDEMQALTHSYPDLLHFRLVGESHDERPIGMLQVGTGTGNLICTAGIHGRETINPILLLKMAEEYCQASTGKTPLNDGYPVRELLEDFSLCLIPVVNPDGYEIAQYGYGVIRNPVLRQLVRMKRITPESWKYNARGVDINRNFPSKSYIQQQPTEYPASEKETQALMHVFQRYTSVAYVDFHSSGKIIYYYRQAMPTVYNQRNYRLAKHLQNISHYNLGRKEEEFMSHLSGGNPVHYYSEYFGMPAITVETVGNEAGFPLHEKYQEEAYREIHEIPLGLMEEVCL